MKKQSAKPVTLKQVADLLKANKSTITQAPIMHDIVTRINNYIEDGKRPLYVYCHTTGKKCGMTAIAYFQKKLDQYGKDIVKLMTEYRGRAIGGNTSTAARSKVSGKYVAPASNVKTYATYVTKTDKKGNPITTRTEIVLHNGGKVVTDFDEATGETTYVKGNSKTLIA
jgi:hypothetical protein